MMTDNKSPGRLKLVKPWGGPLRAYEPLSSALWPCRFLNQRLYHRITVLAMHDVWQAVGVLTNESAHISGKGPEG